MHRALLGVPLVLIAFSGCFGGGGGSDDPYPRPSLWERKDADWNYSGSYSLPLKVGPYAQLPVEEWVVPFELGMEEGGAALTGGGRVHLAVWRPDVPDGMEVPVIADVGPYYESKDGAARPSYMRLFNQSLLPWGYAVAQVSVMGTGNSNHCMDLMGNAEQLGIDAAVTWLGTQDWSNGNVALTGASYDGSTPWEAATFGNPHLKTIIPVSGLIGVHELMWRNGSAELRGPIMHNVVYGQFGIDSPNAIDPSAVFAGDPGGVFDPEALDRGDVENACPDYLQGPLQGGLAYATGDYGAPEYSEYWSERYFLDRVIENYKGSVYLVHGLQDWNVDNHMAFPTHQRLVDAGIEVKGLYGQWQHMFPDTPGSHSGMPLDRGGSAFPYTVRYDHRQDLLEWLDYYLKEEGPKPALRAEVQDTTGRWRVEETYPPLDAELLEVPMGDMESLSGSHVVQPRTTFGGPGAIQYRIPASEADTHIAGMPTLTLKATPTGSGGQVFAHLADEETGHRLGHAIMDLRYHAGGNERQMLVPGQPVTAHMQFFALDAVVPAGHAMVLSLSGTGEDYLAPSTAGPVTVDPGASTLRLPTVDRPDEVFFEPPEWWTFLEFPEDGTASWSFDGDLLPCQPQAQFPTCISRETGPDADPIDGVWVPVEEEQWGHAFTTVAAFRSTPVGDTDCWFVEERDGEYVNTGSANKGNGPCGGLMRCHADWLFLYPYSGPVDHLELQFQEETLVSKGWKDCDEA